MSGDPLLPSFYSHQDSFFHRPYVSELASIALQAGELILKYYQQDIEIQIKADQSPVTQADEEANELIVKALAESFPEIPIIAEESIAQGIQPSRLGSRFWLVDPLDGTKEFINRNGEFTVNIALIDQGVPKCGVVYLPALQTLFIGDQLNGTPSALKGQWTRPSEIKWESISVRLPSTPPSILVSRSHRSIETDEFLKSFPSFEAQARGSSMKLCAVACGEADYYPRLGRTMEWDIAAGLAVLFAAGGQALTLNGAALEFGKDGFENPYFLAWGKGPAYGLPHNEDQLKSDD